MRRSIRAGQHRTRVRALSTTRSGGVSAGAYHSFNLADHVGDDPMAVAENRHRLRERFDLPGEPHWLRQVHGGEVVTVPMSGNSGADAAISRNPGEVCVVMSADCLPLLLCDRDATVVAVAHCGWRGICAGVIEHAVAALGVSGRNVMAWLAPGIGPQAFEVGSEVRDAFVAHDPDAAMAFSVIAGGLWRADLCFLARLRLRSVGVTEVYGGEYCTYSDSNHFYSYRRDGVTGRMATLIWLAPH